MPTKPATLAAANPDKPYKTKGHYNSPLAKYSQNPQELIKQLYSGLSTEQIAQNHGITRYAVNDWLLNNSEDEWKRFQVAKALTKLEEAEDKLHDDAVCTDMLSLARAEKQVKSAQWQLERLFQRIYGTKPDAAQGLTIQVIINDPMQTVSTVIEQDKDPI